MSTAIKLSVLTLAAAALSGCAVSSTHISSDYGRAVRQDVAAQIADPDAKYKGDPAPASNGLRSAVAQGKYEHGQVTPPASSSTSSVSVGGGGGQ
jgi:type IV pilus biogenesis protein CpaD/CtpE